MKLKTRLLATAGTLALLGGALAASPVSGWAATASIGVTSNTAGEAGYYGADDNHTHYRFAEVTIPAEPTLNDLNGSGYPGTGTPGAPGAELCDPNTAYAAQIGLIDSAGTYKVYYGYGTFTNSGVSSETDPCTQSGLVDVTPVPAQAILTNFTINAGDQVYVGVYYDPSGRHYHQLSFGACDITQDVCRQAWVDIPAEEFWEFGIGAATPVTDLTAPADNLLDTLTGANVTCYSCKSAVPISDVKGFYGVGGLTEAQFVNGSDQVVMSPDGSLSGSTFSLFEGSTSS